ncbi:intradiol ring-cleavage dioxygenase [Arthrobacter sp. KK5.5]|uniref:intradiol ring-cleavage dioxygenase n=1 Tax=Arthrobacter sp. KK5.5 TaxID=3373084 RepID=UPI003EE45117
MARVRNRTLPRPDEDIEDQGLGFDVDTLLHRRNVLQAFGLGTVAFGLAACGATGTTSSSSSATAGASGGEIPDETAGPYPGDGSNGPDVLGESGIVRSDIRTSFGESTTTAEGVPMALELTITDLANGGVPFAGVAVYVWHCDCEGRYSMYSSGVESENYLRGVQIADDDGKVTFTRVFPACYPGRWPHIHFEVYPDRDSITDGANAIATSQVALPPGACEVAYATAGYESSARTLAGVTLESDNVFGDDGGASQLGATTAGTADGYTVRLTAGVDTTPAPVAGGTGGPPAGGKGARPDPRGPGTAGENG